MMGYSILLFMSFISVDVITELQSQLTIEWHASDPLISRDGILGLIEANHFNNFSLWHEEDKARRNDMGFEYVYQAKRSIDRFNQERNNCMERIDEYICRLVPVFPSGCSVHTETPGMIIDRLSILALKQYHIREETLREDVESSHIEKCKGKLKVVTQQLNDLKLGFQEVIDQFLAGERSFRVYYQLKMYNDPELNPEIYKRVRKQEVLGRSS